MFGLFLALPVITLVGRSVLSGALGLVAGSSAVIAALGLSLTTTAISLLLSVVIGLPLAFVLARRSFRGKWLAEAFVDLPIVLPPSVAGWRCCSCSVAVGSSAVRSRAPDWTSPSRPRR